MKKSRPCKHLNHLKYLSEVNQTKINYATHQSKVNLQQRDDQQKRHIKKGSKVAYPEEKCPCNEQE